VPQPITTQNIPHRFGFVLSPQNALQQQA